MDHERNELQIFRMLTAQKTSYVDTKVYTKGLQPASGPMQPYPIHYHMTDQGDPVCDVSFSDIFAAYSANKLLVAYVVDPNTPDFSLQTTTAFVSPTAVVFEFTVDLEDELSIITLAHASDDSISTTIHDLSEGGGGGGDPIVVEFSQASVTALESAIARWVSRKPDAGNWSEVIYSGSISSADYAALQQSNTHSVIVKAATSTGLTRIPVLGSTEFTVGSTVVPVYFMRITFALPPIEGIIPLDIAISQDQIIVSGCGPSTVEFVTAEEVQEMIDAAIGNAIGGQY